MKTILSQDMRFCRDDTRPISVDREHPTLQLQDMIADLQQFNSEVLRYLGPMDLQHIKIDLRSIRLELKQYDELRRQDKSAPYTIINGKTFEEIQAERQGPEKSKFQYPSILDKVSDKISEVSGLDATPGMNPFNGEEILVTRFSSYEAFLDQIADTRLSRHQRCSLVVHYFMCMLKDNGLLPNNNRISRLHQFMGAFPQVYAWAYVNRVHTTDETDTQRAYWDFHREAEHLIQTALHKRGSEDLILVGPNRDMQLAMVNPMMDVASLRYLAVELVMYCLGCTLMGIPLETLDFIKTNQQKYILLLDILHDNLYASVGYQADLGKGPHHYEGDWVGAGDIYLDEMQEQIDHLSYLAGQQWEKECD